MQIISSAQRRARSLERKINKNIKQEQSVKNSAFKNQNYRETKIKWPSLYNNAHTCFVLLVTVPTRAPEWGRGHRKHLMRGAGVGVWNHASRVVLEDKFSYIGNRLEEVLHRLCVRLESGGQREKPLYSFLVPDWRGCQRAWAQMCTLNST